MLSIFGRGAVLSTTGSTTSTLLPTYDMQGNKLIVAAVIEKPPRGIYDQLILDIGSNDGVTSGSLVYAPGLILIGSTTEVYSDTARVALYSSVGSMYQVSIGPKHIPAVANGRGGGQYEAQIAQASDVHEGDVVSDAIIGTGPFGVVRAIVSNPSDPFETVLFAPPVSVYNLNWVFVGEKSERQATTTRIIKSKK
jgi:cell shape-determining protein MreC